MEVTSSNWSDDLGTEVESYAGAGSRSTSWPTASTMSWPNRKLDEVLLYQNPVDGEYEAPQCFKRGQSVPVPESVGVVLDLAVDTLLDGD